MTFLHHKGVHHPIFGQLTEPTTDASRFFRRSSAFFGKGGLLAFAALVLQALCQIGLKLTLVLKTRQKISFLPIGTKTLHCHPRRVCAMGW